MGKGHAIGSHEFVDIEIRALREFYFEEGELFVPPTFDSTPEESKAGF